MHEPVTIDFDTQKTESEWQSSLDRFWLVAIPKVFEWLRWVITLAAVGYASKISDSSLLRMIYGVCYVGLMFYYQAYFFRFSFANIPVMKRWRVERFGSFLLSGLLALATYYIASRSLTALLQSR